MDSHAYLTRQGWRGAGHALSPTGQGITKPLLVSRKRNCHGVGKKVHNALVDQWWSKAFDETLKALNSHDSSVNCSGAAVVDQDKSSLPMDKTTMKGGLYGSFVKGQGLEGTMVGQRSTIGHDCDAQPSKNECASEESRSRTQSNEISHTSKSPLTPIMASKVTLLSGQPAQTGSHANHLTSDCRNGRGHTLPSAHSGTRQGGVAAGPDGTGFARKTHGGPSGAKQHGDNENDVQGRTNSRKEMQAKKSNETYDKDSKEKSADTRRRKKKGPKHQHKGNDFPEAVLGEDS
ncbi:MAG: hypothetical protein Q9220_002623 [cf. Caloplaca sp. 1 TL-2023]